MKRLLKFDWCPCALNMLLRSTNKVLPTLPAANVASSDKGGGTASGAKKIYELEADVEELTQALTTVTKELGEGKNAEGKWVAVWGAEASRYDVLWQH